MYKISYFIRKDKFCVEGNFVGRYNIPCYMRDLNARHYVSLRDDSYARLIMQRKPYLLEYNRHTMGENFYTKHMSDEVGARHFAVPVNFINGNLVQLSLSDYAQQRDGGNIEYLGFSRADRSKILGYMKNSPHNMRYDIHAMDTLKLLMEADSRYKDANIKRSYVKETANLI